MAILKRQFDDAAARLIGECEHARLVEVGFNRADMCAKIAKDAFIGKLQSAEMSQHSADIDIVRQIARNLWGGDGSLGFADLTEEVRNAH